MKIPRNVSTLAKFMGWHKGTYGKWWYYDTKEPNEDGRAAPQTWNPYINLEDAMRLVDKITVERRYTFELVKNADGDWLCKFDPSGWDLSWHNDDNRPASYVGVGFIAAHAVASAALKHINGLKPEKK